MNPKTVIFVVVLLSLLVIPAYTMDVAKDVYFQMTGTNCNYHMTDNFSFNNITVYSTALKMNDGNITTYPVSSWINMSMETLGVTNHINFTNNLTAANITIENGYGNFSIANGMNHTLNFQSNDTISQEVVATSNEIFFQNVAAESWYVTQKIATYTTSMTTTVYNLITYYGSATSTAEQFGLDIGSVDYIAMYNGSFYSHTMGFAANNFTTYHGIGYYVYLNNSGSSTYQRNNISDTPYNTQLFNRWNTVGWTNATDTNAECVAASIGSACKYTSSLNADGVTYTTHTVGFTSNNHTVEKGEGYWVWVNTGVSWGRNS